MLFLELLLGYTQELPGRVGAGEAGDGGEFVEVDL